MCVGRDVGRDFQHGARWVCCHWLRARTRTAGKDAGLGRETRRRGQLDARGSWASLSASITRIAPLLPLLASSFLIGVHLPNWLTRPRCISLLSRRPRPRSCSSRTLPAATPSCPPCPPHDPDQPASDRHTPHAPTRPAFQTLDACLIVLTHQAEATDSGRCPVPTLTPLQLSPPLCAHTRPFSYMNLSSAVS